MAHGNGWQAFVNHLAEDARMDARLRRAERIGRILWTMVFSLLITFAVGLVLKALGWI